MQAIDTRSQANVAWMEHQILDHVKAALRVTLGWQVPMVGISRKLSSVQFTLKSFQRHLERLMDIEEQDGYMALVAESKPHLCSRVERLERDHDRFRREVRHLLPEVEGLSEFENEQFERVCADIAALLEEVDRHDLEEIELLQETLLFDEGGEGQLREAIRQTVCDLIASFRTKQTWNTVTQVLAIRGLLTAYA